MKRIKLSGRILSYAIVDDDMFDYLNQWKWKVTRGYTCRNQFIKGVRGVYKSECIKMHRLVMGAGRGDEVDHTNNNKLDNRKANLRFATHAQNMRNRSMSSRNTSGYKGVTAGYKGKWKVTIGFDGRVIYLGSYRDIIEAAKAYDESAVKLFGDFAKVNGTAQ